MVARVANSLGCSITIYDLKNEKKNVAIFDKVATGQRAWGSLQFVNTTVDHVDMLTRHDAKLSGQELQNMAGV